MTTKLKLSVAHNVLAGLLWVFCCLGCGKKKPGAQVEPGKHPTTSANRLAFYRDSVYKSAASLVQSGDLVTRMGSDITSLMLAKFNAVDDSYSHCGIVCIENDTPFVYHCIGGEFNPDQKMRRDPLWLFGHPAENKRLGLYRPAMDTKQVGKVLDSAKAWYSAGLPFDLNFDLETNEAQYCTEMAANAYEAGWQGKLFIARHTVSGKTYIPVDALFLHPGFSLVGKWSY
jgi:hypothetical protein